MSEGPQKRPINYIWPLIGFALGTGIVGPLALSTEPRVRAMAGMICGGVPFAFIGLWYAIRRAHRSIE